MAAKGIFDYLKEGASGLGEYASRVGGAGMDLAQSPIGMIAIMAMLTDYINKQQNKNFGTDPYGGAVRDIKGQRDKYSNLFTQAAAGETTNPQIVLMRQMLQNRATTAPLTSPTVMPPTRYNPYAAGGVGAGGADADLMANIKRLSMGQGENYQGGMGALQNSLANRFGTRAMREGNLAGKLTPYGTPPVEPSVKPTFKPPSEPPWGTPGWPIESKPGYVPPTPPPYTFNPERPGIPLGAVEAPRPVTSPYTFDPLRPGIPKGAVEPSPLPPVIPPFLVPQAAQPLTSPYKTAEEAFAAEGLGGMVRWTNAHPVTPPSSSQLQLPGNLPPELLEMLKLLMTNTPNSQRPGFLV